MSPKVDRRQFLESAAAGIAAVEATASRLSAAEGADADPLGVRDEFPVTREQAYLNTAYVGPISRPVREAAVAYADHKMIRPSVGRRADARDRAVSTFARMFGVESDEVALLYSTSDGENVVASSFDWRRGDNVVLDELHFQTSFVLYRELERRHGIELRIVPQVDGQARIADFDRRIDGRTKLVTVAWVSNRNGFRQDLKGLSEVVHAKGALLYTDAIQALGTFPANLRDEGVDFLCSGAFKWLHADFGVAPFYVRKQHLDRVRPDRFGHSQIAEELPDFRFRLHDSALKYEYSALSYGAAAELDAALSFLEKVGLERVERHAVALARKLRDELAGLGYETLTPKDNASTIVTFVHGRDMKELQKRLDRENVVVTFREGGTQIRAAVAMFNNRSDVDQLLSVLKTMA